MASVKDKGFNTKTWWEGKKGAYLERLKARRPNIYLLGEKVEGSTWDHPILGREVRHIMSKMDYIYDQWGDQLMVDSPLINEPIPMPMNLHPGPEEYITQIKIQRQVCRRWGCFLLDGLSDLCNGSWAAAYDAGGEYFERYKEWLKSAQKNMTMFGMIVFDSKGERGKKLVDQPENKDCFIHVVDKNAHQNG